MYAKWSTLGIRTSEKAQKAKFAEFGKGEVRRKSIPRTPVNKRRKKDRGRYGA